MSSEPELSLVELQEALARWRQTRRPRQIPAELGAKAVALPGRYKTNELLRALGIDHRTLMRWKRQYGQGEAAAASAAETFVELPAAAAVEPASRLEDEALSLTLTRQGSDGSRLTLAGTLSLEHWRVAVELLRAAEEAK